MKGICKRISVVLYLLLVTITGFSQVNYENKTRLNEGWEFLRQDLGNVWEAVRPVRNDSEKVPLWTKVELPHCFNAIDGVEPDVNYYQGPGWYKTFLNIDNPYKNGRTILHFEGAGQKTEVYVYTTKVGSHIGGYDEWNVDITEFAASFLKTAEAERFGGKVPLIIRCDNSRDTELIPSDLSDFNLYGGIYRYLNLVYVPSLSIKNLHTDASIVPDGKTGKLTVSADFNNFSGLHTADILIKIFNPEGKLIKEENKEIGTTSKQELISLSIPKPDLWSPENPALYSCEVFLSSSGEEVIYKEKFGFRHFEFKEKGPFFLNGKRLLLRGSHRHEDHAGVGAAMTEQQMTEEMKMMKAMGVNFIRLGHYQQSRIILDLCDSLGILAWEEIPWCRGGLGGEHYKDQARRMLTNMIDQHRNHPSIILWGMGNENDWPNDFPEFDKEQIRAFMKELHILSHELDNTRLTCIRRCDFCSDIVDVYSPSVWAGWYRGIYTDYESMSHMEMEKVNRFLHVEWGGDSHAGRHAEYDYVSLEKAENKAEAFAAFAKETKEKKDWSETYITDVIDWHLKEQEHMPWLTGTAYWPFKDFSTPVRPDNPIPYVNQKGVVERDMHPKEVYYVFQSYWTDEPMIHIYGHTWPTRWGRANEEKTIKVYSNCDEVELFLNGKTLGVKKRNSQDFPAAGLRWHTRLMPGQNDVRAIGWKGKGRSKAAVNDTIVFDYENRVFGKPAEIRISAKKSTDTYYWVEAELVDSSGIVVLDSQDYIFFEAIGDASLIKDRGTATASDKVQATNGRARIMLDKANGRTEVAVKSVGLKTQFITIE